MSKINQKHPFSSLFRKLLPDTPVGGGGIFIITLNIIKKIKAIPTNTRMLFIHICNASKNVSI